MNSGVMSASIHNIPANEAEKESMKAAEKSKRKWWPFSRAGANRKSEMDEIRAGHDEVMSAMRDMCEILETAGERSSAVFEDRVIKPFPMTALNQMAAQQEQLGGTLNRLDSQLDRAHERDGEVMNALVAVRETNTQTKSTMAAVTTAVENSSENYAQLFERMNSSEELVMLKMKKIQRRANLYNLALVLFILLIAAAAVYGYLLVEGNSVIVEKR